jgi:hypothetical protein
VIAQVPYARGARRGLHYQVISPRISSSFHSNLLLVSCFRHDKIDGLSYVEGAIKSSRGNRDEVNGVVLLDFSQMILTSYSG